ncbi:MAG: DUF4910 domain-containing protein [Maribacter sp.]|nr:DUF4910 domain-containing protein [Maribacter sp.]
MNENLFFKILPVIVVFLGAYFSVNAQQVPLGQENLVTNLDQELSGESAKRNLEYISRLHRMRGSRDYDKAIEFITSKLSDYKLESIELIKIPVDGKIMYGTQKSRANWNVNFAELWELEDQKGTWVNKLKIADWEAIPLVVAQDSKSGEVTAALIDVGSGVSEADYANKNVKGKLVLTSSQPESIASLAVDKYGAAGIISYAQNQVTAWWKEDDNLIRWGHFDYFANTQSFAFMVSLKQARNFQERLSKGEAIRLHAKVETETTPGNWNLLTAIIKGTDPKLINEEILFTCHLDHPRPGANDNASGSVAILEVARTLKKLIDEGKIERPKRTIRFLWSPEIEGTTALLNYKPEFATRTKFNIHMDMVGGGPATKAIFHVSRGPLSIPSFINDVAESFGAFLNETSIAYASGDHVKYPMVAQEGGKEPLHAILGNFHMGSDFEVFTEGSFKIPSVSLHDWPDRYIHTNMDVPANIDPTKLKRSSFIGASSGYYIANFTDTDLPLLINRMKQQVLFRAHEMLNYSNQLNTEEEENAKYYFWLAEIERFNSIKPYAGISTAMDVDYKKYISNLQISIGEGNPIEKLEVENSIIYARNDQLKGGMLYFSYDYFLDHYGTKKKQPLLLSYSGIRGGGGEYSYEALNLVNGENTLSEIRNILSTEFGPVAIGHVKEYLEALESIDVIKRLK